MEDTQRKFLPDNSYVLSQTDKSDFYFGQLGTSFNVKTVEGDYYASQAALTSMGTRLDKLTYVNPTSGDSYRSWADSFKTACRAGTVAAVTSMDSDGHVTDETQYYAGLKAWLGTAGARYSRDVVWVDSADPQQGIKATRVVAEIKSVNRVVGSRTLPDEPHRVLHRCLTGAASVMHQGMHCWRLGGLLGEAKAGLHACISDSLRAGARRPHGVEARSAQGARSRPPEGGSVCPRALTETRPV